jgi:hypothetical protein
VTNVPERNPAGECRGTDHQCTYHASGGKDAWCSPYVKEKAEEKTQVARGQLFASALKSAREALEIVRRGGVERTVLVREGARSYEAPVAFAEKRITEITRRTDRRVAEAFERSRAAIEKFGAGPETKAGLDLASRAIEFVRELSAEACVIAPGGSCSECGPCRARGVLAGPT